MEIYDIIKDKWIMYQSKMKETHSWNPCLWNSSQNPNVIYIAADNAFRFGFDSKYTNDTKKIKAHFDRFGCIEWTDLRENAKEWKLFTPKLSLEKLFQMKQYSNEIWERRSLNIS
eukprot:423555_1